jgi:ABC-type thiamin/hydroxymethylpyrimidine transport system permease subunit
LLVPEIHVFFPIITRFRRTGTVSYMFLSLLVLSAACIWEMLNKGYLNKFVLFITFIKHFSLCSFFFFFWWG